MTPKAVVPRSRANRDVQDVIAHYLHQHATSAALRFVDAVEDAYALIGRQPGVGALRYAHELDIPGLRGQRSEDRVSLAILQMTV